MDAEALAQKQPCKAGPIYSKAKDRNAELESFLEWIIMVGRNRTVGSFTAPFFCLTLLILTEVLSLNAGALVVDSLVQGGPAWESSSNGGLQVMF